MNWHRIFGLVLIDFFTNSPFEVELEKDLSIKRQLLDAAVLRKLPGEFVGRLPDGLENLKDHNLITYKSHHEALDDWPLKELTGHYVNYRKQVSPSMHDLLPEEMFGLHLFSAAPERIRFGIEHYQRRTQEMSGVVNQLFEAYQLEGLPMPYTMEDFRREFVRDHLDDLTPEERLKGLPAEIRLKGLPPEERLKGLPPEERLKGLPLEERLTGLTIEEIEEYLRQIKQQKDGPGRAD